MISICITLYCFWTRKRIVQWNAAGIGWSFSVGKMPQSFCTLYPTVGQRGPVQNIEDQSKASLDLDPSAHRPGGWHFASKADVQLEFGDIFNSLIASTPKVLNKNSTWRSALQPTNLQNCLWKWGGPTRKLKSDANLKMCINEAPLQVKSIPRFTACITHHFKQLGWNAFILSNGPQKVLRMDSGWLRVS